MLQATENQEASPDIPIFSFDASMFECDDGITNSASNFGVPDKEVAKARLNSVHDEKGRTTWNQDKNESTCELPQKSENGESSYDILMFDCDPAMFDSASTLGLPRQDLSRNENNVHVGQETWNQDKKIISNGCMRSMLAPSKEFPECWFNRQYHRENSVANLILDLLAEVPHSKISRYQKSKAVKSLRYLPPGDHQATILEAILTEVADYISFLKHRVSDCCDQDFITYMEREDSVLQVMAELEELIKKSAPNEK